MQNRALHSGGPARSHGFPGPESLRHPKTAKHAISAFLMSPTTISCGFENHSSQRREFHNPNFSVFLQFVTRHFVYPGGTPASGKGQAVSGSLSDCFLSNKKCHEAHRPAGAG